MTTTNKKSFLQGAIILGAAGIVIKFLGAAFRIPLGNLIGDIGLSYYNGAYPIYVLLLTISTAGIPTAISKLVSERLAVSDTYGAHRVFRISFILLFIFGITSCGILLLGAEKIVEIIKNPGAYYSMIAIAPALLFVPIMAAYRGYFQGMQDMKPTATSQIVEQFFRVIAGLTLAFCLFPVGVKFSAAGAASGAAFGGAFGSLFMVYIYCKRRKSIHKSIESGKKYATESIRVVLCKIAAIAIPITIGASIMPIMNLIDTALVMRRLQEIGFTEEAAGSLYGQLAGMVGSIINFPQVLSMSIALSLVPSVAAAYKRRDIEFLNNNIELGIRSAMIIGVPCAFGLMVLAKPIMLLLYPMQKASAISAANCLYIMAFGVLFLSVVQTLTGVLQGLGKPEIPVISLAVGGVLKVCITYYLTGFVAINVKGAAIGTVVAYITATILNLICVKKYTGIKFNVSMTFIKPIISGIAMAISVFVVYKLLYMIFGSVIATVLSVLVGAMVYGLMMIVIRGITAEELKMLPKGAKLIKLVNKIQKNK